MVPGVACPAGGDVGVGVAAPGVAVPGAGVAAGLTWVGGTGVGSGIGGGGGGGGVRPAVVITAIWVSESQPAEPPIASAIAARGSIRVLFIIIWGTSGMTTAPFTVKKDASIGMMIVMLSLISVAVRVSGNQSAVKPIISKTSRVGTNVRLCTITGP